MKKAAEQYSTFSKKASRKIHEEMVSLNTGKKTGDGLLFQKITFQKDTFTDNIRNLPPVNSLTLENSILKKMAWL